MVNSSSFFFKNITDNIFSNLDLAKIGSSFWSSGSNEGDLCNTLKVYSWCSLESTLIAPEFVSPGGNNLFWRNSTAGDAEMDRCLVYKLNSSSSEIAGFEHSPCSAQNFYICEVKDTH
jgi:hypothetical protein